MLDRSRNPLKRNRRCESLSQPVAGNDDPVLLTVSANSLTVIWEPQRIILCDRKGTRRAYEAGTDFEGILPTSSRGSPPYS